MVYMRWRDTFLEAHGIYRPIEREKQNRHQVKSPGGCQSLCNKAKSRVN